MSASPSTILIVDDDQGLVRLIEKQLRREGFATATATSGGKALGWLSEHRPDLMLLDLKLQDLDGKALIRQLSESGHLVPFIIITGQGDERVAVEMMKQGALDYLVKDVRFQEFIPTVVRRGLAQVESAQRLAAAEQALTEAQNEILRVSEAEQRRLGQDLHDGICQHLAGIELMVQALEQRLTKISKPDADRAGEISSQVRETIRETRAVARGLSPVEFEANGLMSALQELAKNVQNMFRIECLFYCPSPVLLDNNVIATHLFRIAQEAVSNAARHSGARHIHIELERAQGNLRLTVCDDGAGMATNSTNSQGMGLRIMKFRASKLGASLSIESKPGGGTSVICSTPGIPSKPA